MPNQAGGIAIKWREDNETDTVTCHVAPVDEPVTTGNWILVMSVQRHILDGDRQLYEDLVDVTSRWLKRTYEEMGLVDVEVQRWPGGTEDEEGEKQ